MNLQKLMSQQDLEIRELELSLIKTIKEEFPIMSESAKIQALKTIKMLSTPQSERNKLN